MLTPLIVAATDYQAIDITIECEPALCGEGAMLYNVLTYLLSNGKWESDKRTTISPSIKSSEACSTLTNVDFPRYWNLVNVPAPFAS